MIRGGTQIVRETLQSAGPVSCCTTPSNGFDYTGTVEFDLQPGDKYGFRMAGSHNDRSRILNGKLTLTVPDVTAPVISPVVTGTKGANGFYASDVKVSWKTEDKESGVSQRKGCDDVTVAADTHGTTFTCTAVSAGGKASKSVTIKRDTTAPMLSVPDTILQENAPAAGVIVNSFEVIVLRGADPAPVVNGAGPTTVITAAPNRINHVLDYKFAVNRGYTQLKRLWVQNLPAGAMVTVNCRGASCPKALKNRTLTRRVAGTSVDISSL